MLDDQGKPRDRRLIDAILILGALALLFIVISQLASVFFYFGDILLTFFLAWLLAFIISPVVTRISAVIPRLPRIVATVLVYTTVVAILLVILDPRRRRPRDLDRRVRRLDPGPQPGPADDHQAVAGLARIRSASARSTCSPRRRPSSTTSTT